MPRAQIAALSLVGSTGTFDAVVSGQKNVVTAAAKEEPCRDGARQREPGMAGTGTGFSVSERGHLLANHQVVASYSDLSVRHPGHAP